MRIVTSTSAAARLAAARAFLSTRPPATELVIVAASQSISIQLAWNWVRWQPHSALTTWYREQFGKEASAPDWDCGGGAQAGDCLVAICHDRSDPRGRDPESRVDWDGRRRVSRALYARFC